MRTILVKSRAMPFLISQLPQNSLPMIVHKASARKVCGHLGAAQSYLRRYSPSMTEPLVSFFGGGFGGLLPENWLRT